MPTYNQEKFVREAIDSVINQEYDNIELVIGDDGSTDETVQILLEYKEKYPKIIDLILSDHNEGITANCNKIIKKCDGDYVAMFAGDDVWIPGKLHKQVALMEANLDAVLCYTKVEVFNSRDGSILYVAAKVDPQLENDIIRYSLMLGASGCSFLIRRSSVPINYFDNRLTLVSDWLFWIDVLTKGPPVYIDEVLARYRRHENNTSNNRNIINLEHLITLNIIKNEYKNLSCFADREIVNVIGRYFDSMPSDHKENMTNMILGKNLFSRLPNVLFVHFLNRVKSRFFGK